MSKNAIIKSLDGKTYSQPITIFGFIWIELLGLLYFFFSKGIHVSIKKSYLRIPFGGLLLVFTYSLVSCYYMDYNPVKLVQQTVYLSIYFFLYAVYFSYTQANLKDLFKKYIKVSYYVALLGLCQVVFFYFLKFDIFSFFTWFPSPPMLSGSIIRLRSVCPESGQLGTLFAPALVYLFYFDDCYSFLNRKKWVVLVAALLTSAMTMIVTLLFIFYFKYISKSKIIDYMFFFLLLGGGAFLVESINRSEKVVTSDSGIPGIIMRVQDTSSVLLHLDDIDELANINSSTYALITNLYVARHAPHRITGTGLGTHQQNYHLVYSSSSSYNYGLNDEEGYSLLNRIYSEFGYLGIIIYLFFVFRHVKRDDVISFSLLFYIISSILRGGNYFIAGIIFFHFFFFISKERYCYEKKHISNNRNV